MDFKKYYKLQKDEAGEIDGGWVKQATEALILFLKNKDKNSKIIDIGCGYGTTIKELEKYGFKNIKGVDLISEKVEYAISKNINALQMDMHDLKFEDNSFDYSFMSHAIEHSLDQIKAISEMIRITKKECMIIAPIEENLQTFLKNSPHTSPIFSYDQWLSVLEKIKCKFLNIDITNTQKKRMGFEIWTTIYKI